ncbi:MAG TPA: diacylglycerol kinase family protein [Gemmatimonadales bacterium]|nr:diacylglycerol kinase family protein [Gemmatimonadales bacterium]
MSQPPFDLAARARSFRYAGRGIVVLLRSQPNAWIHAVATVVALALGFVVGLSRLEWCLVVIAIAVVWSAEAVNTAFEAMCDVASPATHPLVERAKDIAAGAVLIAAIGALVVGVLVFGPHLLGRYLSSAAR